MNDDLIDKVWQKGTIVEGFDSAMFRKDACGAWMGRAEYGNHNSQYGWEVDHIFPQVLGGDNDENNLRPMQWQNNISKGDDFPFYFSAVSAKDRGNTDCHSQFKLNENLFNELKRKYNF